jgi:hypothetical protein
MAMEKFIGKVKNFGIIGKSAAKLPFYLKWKKVQRLNGNGRKLKIKSSPTCKSDFT